MKILSTTFDSAYPMHTDSVRRLDLAVRALRDQGHPVIRVLADHANHSPSRPRTLGWTVPLEPIAFDAEPRLATALALQRNLRKLVRLVRAIGPDVVLAHDLASAHGALQAVREVGSGEVIVDFSGARLARADADVLFNPLWLHFWYQREMRVLASEARILTTSTALRDELVALGCSEARVQVIADGVDTRRFARDPHRRMRPGVARADDLIVAIHGLCRADHVQPLMVAARRLVDVRPEMRFLVLASPVEEDVRRMAVQAGLSRWFHFAPWGHPDSLSAYLGSADIALVAPQGGAHAEARLDPCVLEAAASALPVIAPDTQGNRELATRLGGLTLYAQSSADAITSALVELVRQPASLIRIGNELRSRVESRFSLARLAEAFVAQVVQLPVQAPALIRFKTASVT